MGDKRGAYRVLVGRSEGKNPLGRPRHRRENNIKIDLQEVGQGGTEGIDVAQYRDKWWALVNAIMKLRIL
jgi:hypothetical protein